MEPQQVEIKAKTSADIWMSGSEYGYQQPTKIREWLDIPDPSAPHRIYRFDITLLMSNYTCIWGNGCQGVGDEPIFGCCHGGAGISPDELSTVRDHIDQLTDEQWQLKSKYSGNAIKGSSGKEATRTFDGGCVMLNREGPLEGICALHKGALDAGESPFEWKPTLCSTYPLTATADWEKEDTIEMVTVAPLSSFEWSTDTHWWCVESEDAYVGKEPMYKSWAETLIVMVGEDIYKLLCEHLDKKISAHKTGKPPTQEVPVRIGTREVSEEEEKNGFTEYKEPRWAK